MNGGFSWILKKALPLPHGRGSVGKSTFLVVWLTAASSAWAQAQPEVTVHDAPATFDSRVNLVSVPVVVRDKNGNAVGNLRQEDFQLSDKRRVQTITRFAIETSTSPAGSGAPASAAEAATPEKPQLPERFVAYLFDDVHLKAGDLLNARKAAKQQLAKAFDAKTRVGIFTISARTTQDFTSDQQKIQSAIDRIQPWESSQDKLNDCPYVSYYLADLLVNRTHSLNPVLSDAQISALAATDPALSAVYAEAMACLSAGHSADEAAQIIIPRLKMATQLALATGMDESKASLSMMIELVRNMSALPGSRTIVLAGPGFLLSEGNRVNENAIFEKAIRAGVVINSIDIRGVATPTGFSADDRGYQSSAATQLTRYDQDAAEQSQDVLAEFAANTGGTFFRNSNALEEGLEELAARPQYSYILGFSPDDLKLDGSYHGLKVTLKNGAGLTIEARRGYWAPNHSVSPEQQAKEEMEDAVFSREELMDIPIKVHTGFFKQNEVKAQLAVESQIDLKSLKFRKVDDRNRDKLTVVTGLFDDNGRYIKGTETTVDMQLRDQTLASARAASGLMRIANVNFDVPPGRYVVRVVVRDIEGRSMAAASEGVAIP